MEPRNFPQNKARKQKEAAGRQAAYGALNTAEKVALLDERLGPGTGARKQRERLADLGKKRI